MIKEKSQKEDNWILQAKHTLPHLFRGVPLLFNYSLKQIKLSDWNWPDSGARFSNLTVRCVICFEKYQDEC